MSSLDFDLDCQMTTLEREWRQAYEASIVAGADFQALASNPRIKAAIVDGARQRLNRAEALKARIMARIERLEDNLISGH
jgi:hypothetical protein